MSFHHLRDGGEIHERRRTNAPAYRLRRSVRDHVVALLALRALDWDVAFTDRWTRALHHLLEVMDHRLHIARRLALWRKDDAVVGDVHRSVRQPFHCLFDDPHRLPQLFHADEVAI